ncbi:MAG: exo-alpha-sialidase, partial [candidate division Zixibacteria bacterium]|nr:exo-alpha-sialidase [candidate division Zixibacteria bacterium]
MSKLIRHSVVGFGLLLLLASVAFAGATKVTIEEGQAMEKRLSPGAEVIIEGGNPYQGDILENFGTTWYDYQTNGSTGNRIEFDASGAIHVSWMNKLTNGDRHVYWNYKDDQWRTNKQVSEAEGAGYTNIDKTSDRRSVVCYHQFSIDPGAFIAMDIGPGFEIFTVSQLPNTYPGRVDLFWPYLAIDANDNMHVVMHENSATGTPQVMAYTFSDDMGATWSELLIVDTLMDISCIPVASEADNKVALVYTHPIALAETEQVNNDVYYIESEDGINWNFSNKINITNYEYDDTIRAYTDLDAVYDNNGDLHVVWNTPGYFAEDGTITIDACFLWHWSESTGINMIFDAWHISYPGVWNRSASKMSIGVDNTNHLFAVWTHFDDEDVSAGGFSNGELYMSYSEDGGVSWSEPMNMTDTYSGDCLPEDCDSDHWSSLAETVGENLHIHYINDKDAGGIPQTEGTATENPVVYLMYPNPVYTSVD